MIGLLNGNGKYIILSQIKRNCCIDTQFLTHIITHLSVPSIAGVGTSLGLGTIQLAASMTRPTSVNVAIIWIITFFATLSVVSGLKVGMKHSQVCRFSHGYAVTCQYLFDHDLISFKNITLTFSFSDWIFSQLLHPLRFICHGKELLPFEPLGPNHWRLPAGRLPLLMNLLGRYKTMIAFSPYLNSFCT